VIEGNVIQATSRSLLEEVTFDRHSVTSRDWRSYPVADVRHLPDRIEIALIDRAELASGGAGEPASRPVPAGLANALVDATGVRLRRSPLSPARVAAALV
jgi:nicotinate dehydrogenase subunit B